MSHLDGGHATRKLTSAEKTDRTALQMVRDSSQCTRGMVTAKCGKAKLQRIERLGYVRHNPESEYTDVIQLTWDGADYLGVLEEPWHD